MVKERVGQLPHNAVNDSYLEAIIETNIGDSDTQNWHGQLWNNCFKKVIKWLSITVDSAKSVIETQQGSNTRKA